MSDLMKFNPAFLDEETLVRTFVVRQKELEAVMEVVRENDGPVNQHLLLIGPRGIGKTTLALRAVAEVRRNVELAQRWYPIVFGEESYLVMNAGEFWLEALLQIAEQTGEERWMQAHANLSEERDPERLEPRCLAQLMDFADEQGRRLLLIVENINMMLDDQVSEDEAWHLRHTLLNEPRLMLLGTATRRFEGIEHEGKALYDLFRVVDLHPLDSLNEIGALWALATDEEPRKALLRPIEILTGGNPRLIRILSDFAARTSFRELMDNLIRLIDDHTEYFKHHLDSLPAQERKVFVALADRWDPATAREIAEATRLDVSKVSALLARLEKRGAVSIPKQRGRSKVYQIAERLYNIYHLMRRRGQASARVRAAVRFMVQLYEGETLIPVVSRLIEESCDLSPIERLDHYLAYSEVLDLSDPHLRKRILVETGSRLLELEDIPADLRVKIDNEQSKLDQDESPSTHNKFAWLNRGANLLGIGKYDEAITSFERALAIDSDFPVAWYGFGFSLEKCDRNEEALQAINRALSLDDSLPFAWLLRGNILREMRQYNDSIESFDKCLTLAAHNQWAWFGRGAALMGVERSLEALQAFDNALRIDSSFTSAWRGRGTALYQLHRDAEALEAFDKALALDASDTMAWIGKGYSLNRLECHDEALEASDNALAIDSEIDMAWMVRGIALTDSKRFEDAIEAFDQVLKINPDDLDAWRGRGIGLSQVGRHEQALEAIDRVLDMEPGGEVEWHFRVLLLSILERYEEVLQAFDRADALFRENWQGRLIRCMALSELHRPDEAFSEFEAVLKSHIEIESLETLTGLTINLAAHSFTSSVLAVLSSSAVADDVEPLLVALRLDLGEDVTVAQEIEEVARDILARIEAKRTEVGANS